MRDFRPLIRLIATLAYGLFALALLFFLSATMVGRYLHESAEHSVRSVFRGGAFAGEDADYHVTCRKSGSTPGPPSECDPMAISGERPLRSGKCTREVLAALFRNRWSCVAKFHDGSTLPVIVSIGLGRHHLELIPPLRGPDV